ncbi:MAG: SMP-30/gluconolactonase/LRE family protein [Acidobacteriota bacterium]
MTMRSAGPFLILLVGIAGCEGAPAPPAPQTLRPFVGGVERLSPELDDLLAREERLEVLAEGFTWSEGPVWLPSQQSGFLLFSDVPENRVHRWSENLGTDVWLSPSGFTGAPPRGGGLGSNGLTLSADGSLLLAQHGDRRVARLDGPLESLQGAGSFVTIADRYEGQRFNSPNDLIVDRDGTLFVTDPPYGLEQGPEDPRRELPFHGVYAVDPQGHLVLVSEAMSRPNGVGLSPDGAFLYVANSDPEDAVWWRFARSESGAFVRPSDDPVFFDATPLVASRPGVPDGLAVDGEGNLWASGPGGILVLSPEGRHLGTLLTERATSNCTFGADGFLYITADDLLLRVQTRTSGAGRRPLP